MKETISPPRPVSAPAVAPPLEECFFYHAMDLGGGGRVGGQWDLGPHLDDYWLGTAFGDHSVLEIGPASGYLTAELERRGASVTALELPAGADWDLVP